MRICFLLLLALWVDLTLSPSASLAGAPGNASRDALIIYTGNTLGELKPCGCAKEEDQGGIERRMAYLKQTRPDSDDALLVDLGDNFKSPSRQGRIKAATLLTAMNRMNYDAVTFGEKDLMYGNNFLMEQAQLPWLSSNLSIEGLDIPRYRVKVFPNGKKIGIVAVSDPELFYSSGHSNLTITDPTKALAKVLPELKEKENPDLVVLLTHMKRQNGLKMLELEGVDLVINGHIRDEDDLPDMEPVAKNQKLFVQPGPRGQKMGEIRVSFDTRNREKFQQRMVRLDSKIGMDPGMTALYEKYNEQVEEIFFASLKAKRKKKQNAVYATETTCKTCHSEAHSKWQDSRHGSAYTTLLKVNKAFDPECLICHTTGFNEPGGFISEVDTPELKNVQCEVCHGPRKDHASSPSGGFASEARQACGKCHVRNHSPNFKYETYWPRIRH